MDMGAYVIVINADKVRGMTAGRPRRKTNVGRAGACRCAAAQCAAVQLLSDGRKELRKSDFQ